MADKNAAQKEKSGMDPMTAALIAALVEGGIGALETAIAGGEDSDQERAIEASQEKTLIDLITYEQQRKQYNTERMGRAKANMPFIRGTAEKALGPSPMATARLNAAGRAAGGPGSPNYAALIPNFEKFRQMRADARQMTSGLTAENYVAPLGGTMGYLNEFSKTKGDFLSNSGNYQEALDEKLATELGDGPGRSPERGPIVNPASIPTSNRPGDGYSAADIAEIARAKQSGISDYDLAILLQKLKNDGR